MNDTRFGGYIKEIMPFEDGDARVKVVVSARHMNGGKQYFNTIFCYAHSKLATLLLNYTKIDDYIVLIGYLENNGVNQYPVLIEIETIKNNHIVDGNK